MQITPFGVLVVALTLISLHKPIRLLQLAILVSCFEAAAAFVIGGLGLAPVIIPSVAFLSYCVVQYMLGMRYPGERPVLWATLPLLLLLAYAVLSAALLPDVFGGQVMVWPQKLDPLWLAAVPLARSMGNVTQLFYLSLNVAVAVIGALFLTRRDINYEAILRSYLASGYLIVALSVWQLAYRVAGVPFPSTLLYSNPGWAIVEQSIGSIPRIQGPFSEPAGLAGYITGIVFCSLWLVIRGHQVMWPRLLLLLSVTTTFLSTSTTGIVTVGLGVPLVIAYAMHRSRGQQIRRLATTLVGVLLSALLLLVPLVLLKPEVIDVASVIVQNTAEKRESESYIERMSINSDALTAARETYGLGVGWGSFRAMSFIPGMLANGGVFGLLMVVWFALRMSHLSKRAVAGAAPRHPGRVAVSGFGAALLAQLLATVMAGGMITSVGFFLQVACLIGASARMWIEGQQNPVRVSIDRGDDAHRAPLPAT